MEANDGPTVEEMNGEVNLPPPPSLQRLLAQMIIDLAKQPKDIWRVTAPAALLNGVSLLEYSQHYGDHPLLLASIAEQASSMERMIACVKWYISTLFGSYASRSGGQEGGYERKPYNPILGEQFFCHWNEQKHSVHLTAEQVSHHPPVSAFYIATTNGVHVHGFTGQSTSFNGTGIKVRQEGRLFVFIEPYNEEITITLPELHLFGLASAPYLEITGPAFFLSTSGWAADLDFEKSGFLYGGPDNFTGIIYSNDTGKEEAEIWGNWKKDVFLLSNPDHHSASKRKKNKKTGQLLFSHEANPARRPHVHGLENQSDVESRRVWSTVTRALFRGDYDAAGEAKNQIEEQQRKARKERESGTMEPYVPVLFSFVSSFHFLPFTENKHFISDLDSVSSAASTGSSSSSSSSSFSSSSLSSSSSVPYNGRWLANEFIRKYNIKL